MDFMKVIDQAVREIKREVNLKVLQIPEIEQKVLDATDNEPWGPHGTALAEIAQATKKFSECQMVMNVLWTRLGETGKDWRYVYKALAVIEYLVSHGSERAVDEIIEHTYQISSLRNFEYVEPNGKDVGINVRKKAETIVALLNDRDKIQEVRNKAAANRDKYFGLSSTGVTYKSGAPSFSSGGYGGGDRYGSRSTTGDSDWSRDSFRRRDFHDEGKSDNPRSYTSSYDSGRNSMRNKITLNWKDRDESAKQNDSDKYSSVPSHGIGGPSNTNDDDFDDFDPRGTSSKNKSGTGAPAQVDLFGQDLIGDLLDEPTPGPAEPTGFTNKTSSEIDLFADAAFVSASPNVDGAASSVTQKETDLFASQPKNTPAAPPPAIDLFASMEPVPKPDLDLPKPQRSSAPIVDPFASVPLQAFGSSDPFGSFTSHPEPTSVGTAVKEGRAKDLSGKSGVDSETARKKNTFQVKSGIWADSLSRGIIDLNITAPKKVPLAEVSVVGGLGDRSDAKATTFPTSLTLGSSMATASGLGRTTGGGGFDDFFASLQN